MITSFQTNTIIPPLSIPAIAPAFVVRFQKSEKSISGPKVAPKPAQAKETSLKITLFSLSARIIAIMAIAPRVILVAHITALSLAFLFITPLKIFFAKAEAAIRR